MCKLAWRVELTADTATCIVENQSQGAVGLAQAYVQSGDNDPQSLLSGDLIVGAGEQVRICATREVLRLFESVPNSQDLVDFSMSVLPQPRRRIFKCRTQYVSRLRLESLRDHWSKKSRT
jgi:hypothetical protein